MGWKKEEGDNSSRGIEIEKVHMPFEEMQRRKIKKYQQLFNNGLSLTPELQEMVELEIINEAREEAKLKGSNGKAQDTVKPEVVQPHAGKSISKFTSEIASVLKGKNELFYRSETKEIVEIGLVDERKDEKEFVGFLGIKPNRFITLVEKWITPGIMLQKDRSESEYGRPEWVFKEKSISGDLAKTVLMSQILEDSLPRIDRIFTVPLPIVYEGTLTFPKKGYDERFSSWMPFSAPEISDPYMPLREAKELLSMLYGEFCLQTPQDLVNAISALLTPFLRGLFSDFNVRTPVFFYLANRERAGKDYCAGITGILYEGAALEEAPLSNSENGKSNNTEELRKKILAAMMGGRKRLHFSNNKGYIDNAVFEGVTTAERWSDRILGRSEVLSFDNELDFSLSGNVGVRFTPDLANRCRFVRLFLEMEDANARSFTNPDLHAWVKEHRSQLLSALYALVRNWIEKGQPLGETTFASYSEWAKICGGVMESAGYGSPCVPDQETLSLSGDSETAEMKQLFELCYEKRGEQWIKKSDIRELVQFNDVDIFTYFDFDKRADQTKFAFKILKYLGRVFSQIKLVVKDPTIRAARQEFKFTKVEKQLVIPLATLGNTGKNGNNQIPVIENQQLYYNITGCEVLPTLPVLPALREGVSLRSSPNPEPPLEYCLGCRHPIVFGEFSQRGSFYLCLSCLPGYDKARQASSLE